MNITIDENISFGKETFSQFGKVKPLPGRQITNSILMDTDILIVRSVTKINEELLNNTPVKFVGTATIGTDHVDKEYLKKQNIYFTDAKGCNADAVAEYVFTSIFYLAHKYGIKIRDKVVGIIGVGNIGSRIEHLANVLGLQVIKNDPPLNRKTGSSEFVPLNKIYNADIITLHVPLNKEGIDRTVRLFNDNNFNRLRKDTIFINASRGQVVDNNALLRAINYKNLKTVLDVWETEPEINTELLDEVEIGTPHIAGYSLEGKVNGTTMIYNSLCKFLGTEPVQTPVLAAVENSEFEIDGSLEIEELLFNLFNRIYDINNDDLSMRSIKNKPAGERAGYFDSLRKNYPLRREFTNYKIKLNSPNSGLINILKAFRFQII